MGTDAGREGIRRLLAAVGSGPTNGRALSRGEAAAALTAMMEGVATPAQAGALLLLQRYRGESAEEILGYLDAARARMLPFGPRVSGMLDIGSPHDGRLKHAVISPAAGIVAAAAGVPVLMHGEPRVGPKRGLAVGDVIEALGVATDLPCGAVSAGIEAHGIGYLRQARVAPAFAALLPLRNELGLRTALHIVEKLYRPGDAPYLMLGVAHLPYVERMAPVLAGMPSLRRALVVQGIEGHEDVPTTRGSRIVEIGPGDARRSSRLDPAALGLEPASAEDMAPGDGAASARLTLRVLEGGATAGQRDVVLLNAALRIMVARGVAVEAALAYARDAVASGAALATLEAWRAVR